MQTVDNSGVATGISCYKGLVFAADNDARGLVAFDAYSGVKRNSLMLIIRAAGYTTHARCWEEVAIYSFRR